jgi:hypothetical protein
LKDGVNVRTFLEKLIWRARWHRCVPDAEDATEKEVLIMVLSQKFRLYGCMEIPHGLKA